MRGRLLTTDGSRTLRPVEVNGEKSFTPRCFRIYGSHEGLYGLGQHQAGVWNYRGETVDLRRRTPTSPSRCWFDQRLRHLLEQPFAQPRGQPLHPRAVSDRGGADRIDYYFIYGPEADRIVARYRERPARSRCLALGLRLLAVQEQVRNPRPKLKVWRRKYRALHIPDDNIVQDWFWWSIMGEMKWNPQYPNPQGYDRLQWSPPKKIWY